MRIVRIKVYNGTKAKRINSESGILTALLATGRLRMRIFNLPLSFFSRFLNALEKLNCSAKSRQDWDFPKIYVSRLPISTYCTDKWTFVTIYNLLLIKLETLYTFKVYTRIS